LKLEDENTCEEYVDMARDRVEEGMAAPWCTWAMAADEKYNNGNSREHMRKMKRTM